MANEATQAVVSAVQKKDPNAPMTQPMNKASIETLLRDNAGELAKALPKHLTIERMLKVLVFCIDQNPDLLKCTQRSLFACVKQLAELGLEPGGVRGLAYLIPYRVKGADLNRDCTLIVGYKGLIHLARQSGFLQDIDTEVVHEGDVFKYEKGTTPFLKHIKGDNPGRPTKVWCVATLKNGHKHIEVMLWSEVMAIKARSPGRGDGPWVTDEEQMARKTVIRRASNYLPLSPELSTALAMMDHETVEGEVVRIQEISAPAPKPSKPAALSEENGTGETIDQPATTATPVPVAVSTASATPEPVGGGVKTVLEVPPPDADEAARLEVAAKAEAQLAAEEAKKAAPAAQGELMPPPAVDPVDAWFAKLDKCKSLKDLKEVSSDQPNNPARADEMGSRYKAARVRVLG